LTIFDPSLRILNLNWEAKNIKKPWFSHLFGAMNWQHQLLLLAVARFSVPFHWNFPTTTVVYPAEDLQVVDDFMG
jgi:hypothetical protein